MLKDLKTDLIFVVCFFILLVIFKGWFSYIYLPFFVGGGLGIVFTYVDYLIYPYLLKPQLDVSKNFKKIWSESKYIEAMELIYGDAQAKKELIMHSFYFQLMFFLLSYLVVTSVGDLFGIGFVLGVFIQLGMYLLRMFIAEGSINDWFSKSDIQMDTERQKWYLVFNLVFLIYLGLVL